MEPAWRSAVAEWFRHHHRWVVVGVLVEAEVQHQQHSEVTSLQAQTIQQNKAIIRQALLSPALAVVVDQVEVQYRVPQRVV